MKTLEDNLIASLGMLKELQDNINGEDIYNTLHLIDNMYKKTKDPHWHYAFHVICTMSHHLGVFDASEVALLHTANVEEG